MSENQSGATNSEQLARGEIVPLESVPFEAIIKASTLRDFLAPIDAVDDEFRLQLTEDGFRVGVVDSANVAMVLVELGRDGFESYQVDGEGGTVGVPLSVDGGLSDTLDFADADDLVYLSLNTETRKLDIEFDTVERSLALFDPESVRQTPAVPDLDLAVDVTLTGEQFARSIDLADMVSDHAYFVGEPENSQWVVRAKGDRDAVDDTYTTEDLIDGQVPDEHESVISTSYLTELATPIPNTAEVRVRHGTEMPVKWWYEIGPVEVQNLVAPRITKQ